MERVNNEGDSYLERIQDVFAVPHVNFLQRLSFGEFRSRTVMFFDTALTSCMVKRRSYTVLLSIIIIIIIIAYVDLFVIQKLENKTQR